MLNTVLEQRSLAEHADSERLLGRCILKVRGVYWAKVRSFFYRTLLPYEEYTLAVASPFSSRLGGYQHAVTPGCQGNSSLKFLMFQEPQAYDLQKLDGNRRRQVTSATRELHIAPVEDLAQFKNEGYQAYISFFNQTGYTFGAERRDRNFFENWAERIFKAPKLLILGAFRSGRLSGVSISQLVNNTLMYSMFFCDDDSLKLGCSDLMLHAVREVGAKSPLVTQIYAGMYKGGKGLDAFYILRGCSVVEKPARLSINPLAVFMLNRFRPREYAQLQGKEVGGPDVGSASPCQKPS